MIDPFVEKQCGFISHDISSYGYDARFTLEFKVFINVHNAIPKNFSENSFVKLAKNQVSHKQLINPSLIDT